MANPMKQPGFGPSYEQIADFVKTLSAVQQDGLCEFFVCDPASDQQLTTLYPALLRTIEGKLPTIVWDNVVGAWVPLSTADATF